MRCQYLITGLLVLLAPLASANPAAASSSTTTSTSTTTITRTVVRATQTSTVKGESPSASATDAVASIGNGVMGAQGTGIVQPSSTGSAYGSQTSLPAYSYLGAASTERGNWNVVVMAGSIALVLGYAL